MHATVQPFVKVAREKNQDYFAFFKKNAIFANFINFAFGYTVPEIWVDATENPRTGMLFCPPAVILQGDTDAADISPLFDLIPKGSWIVPTDEKWEKLVIARFEGKYRIQNRTSFDHTSLRMDHIQALKKELPSGLSIVTVGEKQARDKDGILFLNDLQYFYSNVDFVQCGLGFCILDGERMVAYAVSNFPLHDNLLEVSIRVINDEKYRGKGLAQAVSIALLEYCLQNNIEPNWDAANETSAHIALKLGYTLHKEWRMYNLTED